MRSGGLSLLVLLICLFALPARAATPAEVEKSIQKAIDYLYKTQNSRGTWDPAAPDKKAKHSQWGGPTAIATYALLAAGESPQDPRLKKAIDFLIKADIEGIYALGLRAQIYHFIKQQTPEVKAAIRRDGDLLLASIKSEGNAKGMFNYPVKEGPSGRYDHSVSQYGVLGLWAVAQMGYEVPTSAWLMMDHAWREHQDSSGGWEYIYKDSKEVRASMTAAGVATLFITQDYLNAGKGVDCTGNIRDHSIDMGLKWMSANTKDVASRRAYYTLYGIERIGVASGLKYFGTVDWYDDGAEYLVRNQDGNGGWDGVPDTCFSILFLVRGRAPVVMNKLEYDIDTVGDKAKLANWNQRPRDCANLVRWMGKQLEKDLNWQIVNLKVPVDDLHDAPILYIAGNQNLAFSAAEEAKLKLFVQQGGMIVGNADCGSLAFANAFQKLGSKLFPDYEFRDLPKDHLIYTSPFHYSKWKIAPPIRGMSNGARELMILLPMADFSKLWQLGLYAGREEGHQMLWNLYFYAIDKQNMRYKGQTYIVHKSNKVQPSKQIKVARLEYSGNWNPEPGGWKRLAAIMHNHNQTELLAKPIKPGSGALLKGDFHVAHLTGTTKFRLDAPAAAEIQKFIDGGGTLIVDSCGGSSDFTASAEEQLIALFPSAKLNLVPPEHKMFGSGGKPVEVGYRNFAKKLVGNLHTPRIRAIEIGNRPAILFSAEDLSTGLVGMSLDGIYGYDPESATKLMRAMVQFAHGAPTPIAAKDTPATPTPKPAPPKKTDKPKEKKK